MADIRIRNSVDIEGFKREFMEAKAKKLSAAMQEAATEIVERTQGGHEIEGQAFKSYCEEYRDWKNDEKTDARERWTGFMQAVGGRTKPPKARKRVGLGAGDIVNLTLSGDMLQSVQTEIVEKSTTKIKGKIFVPSGDEAAKARWNMATRPFFGLSRMQKEAITNKLK